MVSKAITYTPVTITSGAATSTTVEFARRRLAGVLGPTAWTAADISFEVSDPENTAWRKVVDCNGALVRITGVATSSSESMLPPEIADRFVGEKLRLVSTNAASEANATQGADRTLYVLTEEL